MSSLVLRSTKFFWHSTEPRNRLFVRLCFLTYSYLLPLSAKLKYRISQYPSLIFGRLRALSCNPHLCHNWSELYPSISMRSKFRVHLKYFLDFVSAFWCFTNGCKTCLAYRLIATALLGSVCATMSKTLPAKFLKRKCGRYPCRISFLSQQSDLQVFADRNVVRTRIRKSNYQCK